MASSLDRYFFIDFNVAIGDRHDTVVLNERKFVNSYKKTKSTKHDILIIPFSWMFQLRYFLMVSGKIVIHHLAMRVFHIEYPSTLQI